ARRAARTCIELLHLLHDPVDGVATGEQRPDLRTDLRATRAEHIELPACAPRVDDGRHDQEQYRSHHEAERRPAFICMALRGGSGRDEADAVAFGVPRCDLMRIAACCRTEWRQIRLQRCSERW